MTSTVARYDPTATPAQPGCQERRAADRRRLRRIEGQVRGIARMLDADRPCVDVLTQVSAATRALQQVALGLVGDHLRHCVMDAARTDPADGAARLDQFAGTLRQALRL